jgi:flagellar protein FliJ
MKPRESMLRLRRFEAEERARKVADIESMIREFETMATDLTRQISSEEERTGIKDPKHFAYSTFAKAAAQRRDNLATSVEELRIKLTAATLERDIALDNLRKLESEGRDSSRGRHRSDQGSGAQLR